MLEIQSTDLIMDLTAILKGRQSLKKNNSELKVQGKGLYQPI